ncbi:MAG TPA: hypothetical protein VKB84_14240 [Candidatus Binataceae bacterium]|nr:hypothetical protein [Candidatus Binataceae bacterium]
MKQHLRIAVMLAFTAALAVVTLGTYTPPPPAAPHFFDYFGDGSEPDPDASGTVTLAGEHNYVNFTVQAGATVNIVEDFNNPPSSSLIVRSTGTCTIAGTINGRGAANPVYTIGGPGGGGGGNAGAAGLQALGVVSPSLDFSGGAGGASGSPGGAGQGGAPLTGPIKTFVLDELAAVIDSSGGMPGGAGAGAVNPFDCHNAQPGNGGCAGAGLVLACREIDFQATAVVDLRGQDGFAGAPGPGAGGGGGGGGGGYFFSYAIAYIHSPATTGTVLLNGGIGGAGGDSTTGAGGIGSAGWSRFF